MKPTGRTIIVGLNAVALTALLVMSSAALAACNGDNTNGQTGTGIENGQTGTSNPGVENPGDNTTTIDEQKPETGNESVEAKRQAFLNETKKKLEDFEGCNITDVWIDEDNPNVYHMKGTESDGKFFNLTGDFPPELQLRIQ
jgi:hypothetical protein